MIPHEHLTPYLWANGIALGVLAAAFYARTAARWICAGVFAWAAVTNATIALTHPERYVEYASLTPSAWYRDFILGWFSEHVRLMVLPIAMAQLGIAGCLASRSRALHWLGAGASCAFLLAIAPLGVGSGFPFSLTFGAALLVAVGAADISSPALARAIWWSPRVLGLLLAAFLGLFALDAFDEATGALVALGRFAIHLLPAGLVLAVILFAWRWERTGGALLFVLAVGYGVLARGRVSWMLAVSLPLVIEGALFLWSSLRPGRRQPSS